MNVLAYASVPAAAIVAGGALAAWRAPGPRLRSSVQHFAAGLVFAAVAVELLPDILHARLPVAAMTGFALGVAVMLGIKALTGKPAGAAPQTAPRRLLAVLAIDIAIDGLLIGLGFAAGAKQGALLTAALTVEVLFLGLSAGVALTGGGGSRAKVIGITAALGILLLTGAVTGAMLLGGLAGDALEIALSFGAAALLYLVTEELLVEAHEEPETPLLTAMFFAGFIILPVVEMIAPA